MYEYFEELDQMNWSARINVLNQYLRNTSIGTTVIIFGSSCSKILGVNEKPSELINYESQ